MGLPVIVDIVIGLAFIYLLLSLLASEIQELTATLLQWRAKHLKDSIVNLFASDVHSNHSVDKAVQLTRQVYQHPLIRGINQESRGLLSNFFRGITWLSSRIYRFFTGRTEGEFGDQKSAPSYIPKEAFATALLEQLGTKHFVERLIEAKFSEFIDTTNQKVRSLIQQDDAAKVQYEGVEKRFEDIKAEFLAKKIDVESAINSISELLNDFIGKLIDSPDNTAYEDLKAWKGRLFGKDTKRVIANAGINPTLEEIVESIDKGSKTYHTYRQRFRSYEERRLEEVYEDLISFERFLGGFVTGLLKYCFGEVDADSVPEESPAKGILAASNNFRGTVNQLDEQFFQESSDGRQRSKLPLSRINLIILEALDSLIAELEGHGNVLVAQRRRQPQVSPDAPSPSASNSPQSAPPSEKAVPMKRLRHSLHAFREGFAGKIYLSDLRHFFLFKESLYSQILPFVLFLILGALLVLALSLVSKVNWSAPQVLIGPYGGPIVLAVVLLSPLVLFLWSKFHFSKQKRERRRASTSNRKSLAGIFDDHFASDAFNREPPSVSSGGVEQDKFVQEVTQRLKALDKEPTVALYTEMKDLGRSFRRYYLRFLLENADVDLVFIPSSVKQSLAVLIRRSKTSAKQAEDQILYLKAEVEAWYDRSMARASGVYRRNAKGISILIGLFIAIAINANSIHILDQLAFDEELRQTMVSEAQRLAEDIETGAAVENAEFSNGASPENSSSIAALQRQFRQILDDDINLPIGWDIAVIDEEFSCGLSSAGLTNEGLTWKNLYESCLGLEQDAAGEQESADRFFHPTAMAAVFLGRPLRGLKFVLGWLLTGIAISMGASFWFDLLSRLVKVRNTGRQIPTSVETPEADDVAAVNMLDKRPK